MQTSAGEPSGTVLVADDEPVVRNLIAGGLRRAGFAVIEALDGLDALMRAGRHGGAIDLLITDLEMPRLGGERLCELLRAQHPETKVLIVTGRPPASLEPPVPVLRKPFRMAELLRIATEILQRRPAA